MMKMKKILFKIVGGFMFASAIISCQDDFLSTTPLSEIAESNVWSSAKLAEAAVLDLYQGTWAGTLTREETTDGYTEGKMNPSGGYMDMQWFSWTQLYPFIRSANIAIQKLTDNEGGLEAGLTKRLLGEAYFMRGYFYSQLMRQYGGVVLLTEPLTLDSEAENPRSSFEATVNQIISDIDQ